MSEILFQYHKVPPTTWAYLSALLMIGLYFKFGRLWSVRNLDVLLLISLAPGLLLVHAGHEIQVTAARQVLETAPLAPDPPAAAREPAADSSLARESSPPPLDADDDAAPSPDEALADAPLPPEDTVTVQSPSLLRQAEVDRGRDLKRWGFVWLLSVGLLLLLRLLIDPTMVRRPLLEPNLSTGGMIFIGCAMFVFLMANVITNEPTDDDLIGPRGAESLLTRRAAAAEDFKRYGPGLPFLHVLPSIPTIPFVVEDHRSPPSQQSTIAYVATAKTMAILAHLAVIVGMVAIGYWHFDNVKMGIGAALLYLMLPYTAQMTGRVPHVLPAALLIWAIVCYRRPLWSGVFLGLAIGVIYFPVFLLPLWLSFYWPRGLGRFLTGLAATLLVIVGSQALVSPDLASFVGVVQQMFGLWQPIMDPSALQGVWGLGWSPWYRLPVLALFVVLSVSLAIVPAQKNLGTLLSCTAALMVAAQFWHGQGGGLYMAWYLPPLLMTIFRPNLEDRVALNVLGQGWFPRRRIAHAPIRQAA